MSDEDSVDELGLVFGQAQGVRVFWVRAASMQELVDLLAIALGEHMADGDELHVTYNAMQSGHEHHPGRPTQLLRPGKQDWTELFFEYSAFVVLRAR